MKRISIKSVTIGIISLVLAGYWSYKHEGFLDVITPEVPVGVLNGYYVRRFSVCWGEYGFSDYFMYGKEGLESISKIDKENVSQIMVNRYPEVIKKSQGVPIDVIIKLKSENFNFSLLWSSLTIGILPGVDTRETDCEIIVSSDGWRGSQNMRFRSEMAVSISPLALCALEEPDKHSVSINKDSLFFPLDVIENCKYMRSVFAETLADTVVHIIKTAELKEFENNKKGN